MKIKERTIRMLLFTIVFLFLASAPLPPSTAATGVMPKSVTESFLSAPRFTPPAGKKMVDIKVITESVLLNLDILQTKVQGDTSRQAKGYRQGTVLVLVNSDIYPGIKPSVGIYTTDLSDEGYAVSVYTVKGKDPMQLKTFLRSWWLGVYNELLEGKITNAAFRNGTGIFLVGDLPVPLVHSRSFEYTDEYGVKKPYEGTFVCDLYYTDMDGNWDFVDESGIPFISTVDPGIIAADSECTPDDFIASVWKPAYKGGKGGAKPEVWMGRLAASPLSFIGGVYDRNTEIKLLKEYFERNHAYRHGMYPYVPAGKKGDAYAARDRVAYYDDPWASSAIRIATSYNWSWPGPIVHDNDASSGPVNRYISLESITSNTDYLARLPKFNLWSELLVHSNPWWHEFVKWAYNSTKMEWEWQDVGWISTDEIATRTMNSLFYNMQGCDTCDYRQTRYLGGRYLFTGKSLAVIGNTTVGPHDSGTLHQALAYGTNIGLAYMLNQKASGTAGWITNMVSGYENFDAKRYYGQTLLGDPTLKPIPFIPKSAPVSIGHGTTDYARLVPLTNLMPQKSTLKAVSQAVKSKLVSEARNKVKKISSTPVKGYEYMKTNLNLIIQDPQFKNFVKMPDLTRPPLVIPSPVTMPSPAITPVR